LDEGAETISDQMGCGRAPILSSLGGNRPHAARNGHPLPDDEVSEIITAPQQRATKPSNHPHKSGSAPLNAWLDVAGMRKVAAEINLF